jgi:hypothetical protein
MVCRGRGDAVDVAVEGEPTAEVTALDEDEFAVVDPVDVGSTDELVPAESPAVPVDAEHPAASRQLATPDRIHPADPPRRARARSRVCIRSTSGDQTTNQT